MLTSGLLSKTRTHTSSVALQVKGILECNSICPSSNESDSPALRDWCTDAENLPPLLPPCLDLSQTLAAPVVQGPSPHLLPPPSLHPLLLQPPPERLPSLLPSTLHQMPPQLPVPGLRSLQPCCLSSLQPCQPPTMEAPTQSWNVIAVRTPQSALKIKERWSIILSNSCLDGWELVCRKKFTVKRRSCASFIQLKASCKTPTPYLPLDFCPLQFPLYTWVYIFSQRCWSSSLAGGGKAGMVQAVMTSSTPLKDECNTCSV